MSDLMFQPSDAGQFHHRVSIQTPGRSTVNALGEEQLSWTTTATVWAGIDPGTSRELVRAGQVKSEQTHTIKLRFGPTITADCRITFGTRIFNLIGPPINVAEQDRELHCAVVEVKA